MHRVLLILILLLFSCFKNITLPQCDSLQDCPVQYNACMQGYCFFSSECSDPSLQDGCCTMDNKDPDCTIPRSDLSGFANNAVKLSPPSCGGNYLYFEGKKNAIMYFISTNPYGISTTVQFETPAQVRPPIGLPDFVIFPLQKGFRVCSHDLECTPPNHLLSGEVRELSPSTVIIGSPDGSWSIWGPKKDIETRHEFSSRMWILTGPDKKTFVVGSRKDYKIFVYTQVTLRFIAAGSLHEEPYGPSPQATKDLAWVPVKGGIDLYEWKNSKLVFLEHRTQYLDVIREFRCKGDVCWATTPQGIVLVREESTVLIPDTVEVAVLGVLSTGLIIGETEGEILVMDPGAARVIKKVEKDDFGISQPCLWGNRIAWRQGQRIITLPVSF